MNILLVGDRPEAYWALGHLSRLAAVERIFHLRGADEPSSREPMVVSGRVELPGDLLRQSRGSVEIGNCRLRDRWGKQLLSMKLPSYSVRSFPDSLTASYDKVTTLPRSVELGRLTVEQEGLLYSLSDGSELSVAYAVFADGESSRARAYVEATPEQRQDSGSVGCWSFRRPDLLGVKDWEFRWALGKSVEQVPLPDGQVWVRVRFRSPFGSRLPVAELKELFSEFGADMSALFDGLEQERVQFGFERQPEQVVFHSRPRIIPIGRACWGSAYLQTFDWESSFLEQQFDLLMQALEGRSDWEAYTRGLEIEWEKRQRAERFLRTALHYDNSLLRPLRDLLVAALPNSMLAPALGRRLYLA